MFEISRSRALKRFITCPYSKNFIFISEFQKWPKFDQNREIKIFFQY